MSSLFFVSSFCLFGAIGFAQSKQPVILLVGGEYSEQTFELYSPLSPEKNQVLPTKTIENRYGIFGNVLNNDTIMYGGGIGPGDMIYLNTVEIYTPSTGKVVEGPPMNSARWYPSSALLNGVLYVCGGWRHAGLVSSCEKFTSNGWEMTASLPGSNWQFAMVTIDKSIYAIGGWNNGVTSDVFVYDAEGDKWNKVPSMIKARSSHAAAVIQDKIVVCGGFDGANYINDCEINESKKLIWSHFQPMKQNRANFRLVAFGEGMLVALGGQVSQNSVEINVGNTWDESAPLIQRHDDFAAVFVWM